MVELCETNILSLISQCLDNNSQIQTKLLQCLPSPQALYKRRFRHHLNAALMELVLQPGTISFRLAPWNGVQVSVSSDDQTGTSVPLATIPSYQCRASVAAQVHACGCNANSIKFRHPLALSLCRAFRVLFKLKFWTSRLS